MLTKLVSDCFTIYTSIESLFCILEANIMYENYTSIKKKGINAVINKHSGDTWL